MCGSVATISVRSVRAPKMDEGPSATSPLLHVGVTVEPLLLGGGVQGSFDIRVGEVSTTTPALTELHGSFNLDTTHRGSLGHVPLSSAVVSSVDVLNTSPEVAKRVVTTVGGFKLADFSFGWVTANTKDGSVVANSDLAVVETRFEKESVSAARPLSMVTVSTHLAIDRVSERLAAVIGVDDLNVISVPVGRVGFRCHDGSDHC